ncbi:Ig-like domain-containing protein [Pontiellaceae bacterium B12219]|nr:Ig-like domain-containing protein [Pontiellaceae bacterium B12219]
MMHSKITVLGTALIVAGLAQGNLISNGGFENPVHTANDGTNPADWSVYETTLGTNPDRQVRTRNNKKYAGSMGVQIGAGNSDHTGQLWQTVTTVPGQDYAFEIWAATFLNNGNNASENFQVDLRDGTGTNGTVLASIDSAGTLTGTWQLFTTNVTAVSTALTIHISNISTAPAADGNDLVLDGVSFAAIEEPTSLLLGSPFQDGMVLQRDKPIHIWGSADPANSVSVSINGVSAVGMSDTDGNWKVELPALQAGGPFELETISGDNTNTLTDVLVGDVWIAFGQSNMVRPLSEMTNKQTYIDDISTNRMIRCLQIAQDAALTPQDSGSMTWLDNSNPGSWGSVAAVFAHQMHEGSGVPTAVIWAGWGSSSIEGWMPIQMTNDFPHFDEMMKLYQSIDEYTNGDTTSNLEKITAILNGEQAWDDVFIRTRPNIIYNQRIHPLLDFGISGFVWYQGEANSKTAKNTAQYGFTLPAFVTEYRELFGQSDLPFLGVQLPSYNSTYWAWFRESQNQLTTLSNAYVAVTIDTGLSGNIHPYDKEPIGKRLALLGRKYALGEAIEAHGPTFENWSVVSNQATIGFSHATGLTTADALDPAGFELAGADGIWYAATSAAISGTNVIISSTSVSAPVAVRYAWLPYARDSINLVNSDGLPAAPFRTDIWAMPDLGAQAPMAVSDHYSVITNELLHVPAVGILENDIDLNRDPLTATLVSDAAYGTLTLSSAGTFSYTADTGFSGNDSFVYAVSDGALSSTGTVTIAVLPGVLQNNYSDTFDNDGLAINMGIGGGLLNKTWFGSSWQDDGNLTAPTAPTAWFRSLVYSDSSFSVSDGFTLDVTYDISKIAISGDERTTATFGLVSDEATVADMDFMFSREADIYGIGMSLAEGLTDGIGVQGLHTDTGTLTPLSNTQTVTTGTDKTFSLTVKPDGSWSYSIDGAVPTTGTSLVFDLSKNYRFAAYVRQDPGFAIKNVSLAPVTMITEIGDIDFEIQPGATALSFSWFGETGATYDLEMTENLVTGMWETITNVTGADETISLSDAMDQTNAFYRIRLGD